MPDEPTNTWSEEMQKLLAIAAVLILASIITVHYVFADDTSDRPNGVDAKNWIKVSDRLGFVFETSGFPSGGGDRQILLGRQPLRGYFSAKTPGGWQRLAIENPGDPTPERIKYQFSGVLLRP
jgi:hypothetical protein